MEGLDTQTPRRSLTSRAAGIVWFLLSAAALIVYVCWNEPLRRMTINLAPLVLSLLFVLSLCGIGAFLARIIAPKQDRWIEALTAFALGMGLTAILNFALGLYGLFNPWISLAWTSIGLVLFLIRSAQWFSGSGGVSVHDDWRLLALAMLVAFLAQSIPYIVAPDVSTDSLAYHLLVPKLYLAIGRVEYLPFFVEANYPSLAEYNYLPILQLTTEEVCKCFHFWTAIATLLAIAKMVRRVSPASSGTLAAACFFSMPVVTIHIGHAWNDFVFTLFILLALYYLLEYHLADERNPRDLLAAGVLAGLASWTKYTFVLFYVALLLMFVVGMGRWKWKPRDFSLLLFGIALVAPFWLLQNWLFTQNPVYPFLNGVFHSPYWSEAAGRYFRNAVGHFEIPDWNWRTYATFPFWITLRPRLVDIHTGILPLAFLPLVFFKADGKGVAFLKAYLGFFVIGWLFIHSETRSMLSWFAVLFCVAATVLQRPSFSTGLARRAVTVLIGCASLANLLMALLTTHYLSGPMKYFVGLESKSSYVTAHAGSQRAFDFLNAQNEVKIVLLVGPHEPYYLNRQFLFSSFSDTPIVEALCAGSKGPDEIADRFRRLGISHVVVNLSNYRQENADRLYSWTAEERASFERFLSTRCNQVWRDGEDIVLQVATE